jgi:hypothetical protein
MWFRSLRESAPVAAARRSRPAGGHFLLLAQKKVTKEEGLKTHLAAALGSRPTNSVEVAWSGMGHGADG